MNTDSSPINRYTRERREDRAVYREFELPPHSTAFGRGINGVRLLWLVIGWHPVSSVAEWIVRDAS